MKIERCQGGKECSVSREEDIAVKESREASGREYKKKCTSKVEEVASCISGPMC